ncbi:MAG: S9 family peptidase, partial [Pseudomonadota bacterium]
MKRETFVAAALFSASLISAPLAADDHSATAAADIGSDVAEPMSAKDLITMPRLGAPTVTPYGRYAVYSVTETDPETYERVSKHYLLDLVQPGARPIALDLGIDAYSLAFGADNYLYFLSYDHLDDNADDRARVWRVALE